ncbi:uncharacterized protein CCR75_006073 [Bremia lactucae]|uniref:PX domain-containing protein n=1 Tax=Bremia lactucae TaxID=4779 RepID=A0A976ICG0_BRELC|nr:hypothetical protein CCR75_006073 [Bremia lactucae]
MYSVFVRNVTTGGKCVVRKRNSDFFKLRKELMELDMSSRLLRSSRSAVVNERMDSLGLFLRHMLLCLMVRSFEN